jgi:hypothetical protein
MFSVAESHGPLSGWIRTAPGERLVTASGQGLVNENYNLASSLEVADLFGGWIDTIAGS